MGKLGSAIVNKKADEGGSSGSESVEEITLEDFDSGYSRVQADSGGGDCWIKYPRGFVHSLANFAWQQAVNNKPLTDPAAGVGRAAAATETVVLDSSGDDEKEEGELEEGEIDGDISGGEDSTSEAVHMEVVADEESSDNVVVAQLSEIESQDIELTKKTKSVEQVLLTLIETKGVEKSFRLVCSEARSSLDTLLQLTLDNPGDSLVGELVQKAFLVVESVYSAFCTRTPEERKLLEDDLLWFFCHVKDKTRALFSQRQMDKVESLINLVVSNSCNAIENNKASKCIGIVNNIIPNNLLGATSSLQNAVEESSSVTILEEALKRKPTVVNSKGRRELGPLLDLHIDYDESSLPSPTRAAPTSLSALKPSNDNEGPISTGIAMIHEKDRKGDDTQHASVTDVLKAVSSYQQKFGRTSLIMSDRLPSPTPSDDNDEEGGDPHGEVSSLSRSSSGMMNLVPQSSQVQLYYRSDTIGGTGHEASLDQRPGLDGSGMSSTVRASAKNRDPRRRLLSSQTDCGSAAEKTIQMDNFSSSKTRREGFLASRKLTDVDDIVPASNDLKRPRIGKNDPITPRDPRLVGREGGGLVNNSFTSHLTSSQHRTQFKDVDVRKPINEDLKPNTLIGNGGSSDASTSTSLPTDVTSLSDVSLPSLLKEIAAVNPTMLFQLIQLEQKRLASESQNNLANLGSDSSIPSSSMLLPSAPSITAREKPQDLVQGSSKNTESDLGIVRMKPRDPRRILQTKLVQKTEDCESDELKQGGVAVTSYVDASRESTPVLGQSEQAESAFTTSLPDIGLQFTKTLKKVADIVSHPQFESTSQSTLSNVPRVDERDEGDVTDERIVPQQSPWGDEERQNDKYDDEKNGVFQRERARRMEEQKKMFAGRKLCLVLDLDHTLLNSAKFMEIDPPHEEMLRKKEEIDREKLDRHLFKFSHLSMWTKLRPGIWNFLEKASKLFELHLYTMGNKLYATEMAKILDPTGVLFSGRVISRGDDGETGDGDERVPKSKDLDGVLGMESAVIIIDDSVRVWPLNRHNLILVERYTFFPCSRRQFGLLGPSLLEIDHDERPEDGTLASCLAVIERIHQIFFSHPSLDEVDVRSILASEQNKILSGCRILFSRIFPVGEANPHLHPLWQTAEQFGAVCTNQIDEHVTHVVANSLGTDKVNWALNRGRFVVHPGWVEASALLYRRANEREFAVKQ